MIEKEINDLKNRLGLFMKGVDFSDFDRAMYLLSYMKQAEECSFTTFYSYRVGKQICEIVENNLALCLTSDDVFARTLAEQLGKEKI